MDEHKCIGPIPDLIGRLIAIENDEVLYQELLVTQVISYDAVSGFPPWVMVYDVLNIPFTITPDTHILILYPGYDDVAMAEWRKAQ